ncbi:MULTISPECIES: DUF4276 family protein [unclassified Brevundimonas]|uniref:DUF4276 family protein n=1 Tax=unclassified Brevundimonas TaxID=2622653 RepID=UPI0025B8F683|nr:MULTISPECIES: DUF4276 family protein [unclassified Brevundimonas]
MPVDRLLVFCEGQTEETFCNIVLEPHLRALGVHDVRPLLLPNKAGATARRFKGGWNSYAVARRFMRAVILEQGGPRTLFTTLFDLYAIPDDYPGLAAAPAQPPVARVAALERAMETDLAAEAGGRLYARLQLHEYEALLFSDLEAVVRAFPDSAAGVKSLRADIGSLEPEDVNERPEALQAGRADRPGPDGASQWGEDGARSTAVRLRSRRVLISGGRL